MTNPTYDFPHDFSLQQRDIPTRPRPMHIPVSNKVLMVKKIPIVHNDEENPQFTRNMPNSKSAHLMTKVKHFQMNKVAEMGRGLGK